MSKLTLDKDGAELFAGAALPFIVSLEGVLDRLDSGEAGLRIAAHEEVSNLLGRFTAIRPLRGLLPVRCVLFDKSPNVNWALGWHQDRTIAVKQRRDVEGFGPWTTKQGITHVEPPFELIERMLTARLHLDPVDELNAPLKIVRGSHYLGKLAIESIDAVVKADLCFVCKAARGDVWIYKTPIVHASDASRSSGRRRVLQIDFSADHLPAPLE